MRSFGLIGYPLTHSFSKKYFTAKFERAGIKDHVYALYPLEQIQELDAVLASVPTLVGLNVTIPYKEQVVDFLDVLSPVVADIGACNCIHIKGGQLIGYNTDVIGFSKSLTPQLQPHHSKALVLGTGGAAKAVQATLRDIGIEYVQVSRRASANAISYADIDRSVIESHKLIINTTPLGMHPHTDGLPSIPYQFLDASNYLFDLVYNPVETRFLAEGMLRGATTKNGEDMLVIQAEASWDIWNA